MDDSSELSSFIVVNNILAEYIVVKLWKKNKM